MASRILLIEDDKHLRQALARLLARTGYEVNEAENGRDALEQMAKQPADLVITDMIMPVMEGVETIVALHLKYAGVKILALSGGGIGSAESYLKIAHALGCQKTLMKPLMPEEFLEAIRGLLGT